MLFTFRSGANADVIMFEAVARKLLKILGKDPEERKGIITVEQLPAAIEALKLAIEADKAEQQQSAAQEPGDDSADEDEKENASGMAAPVNLAQRAWPLLETLELSVREKVPVIWQAR